MKPTVRQIGTVATAVRRHLLPWFSRCSRDLPWRRRRDPYRVLVSELMLQQTRVDQVLPYYRQFLARFPSLTRLARADGQAVLKAWEGLGYYARARNLHAIAGLLDGKVSRIPRTVEGLKVLPGIGPYTAAAVASIAFGVDAAAVDGNVKRVISRLFLWPAPPQSEIGRLARALLVPGRAGAFNEAMMELGATVCRVRSPLCGSCPLTAVCRARKAGAQDRIPRARPRRLLPHLVVGAAVTRNRRGEFLIARRRDGDMLGGLWEFPGGKRKPGESLAACIRRELVEELGIEVKVGARLTVVHHAYSHFAIELHAHEARIIRGRPRCRHCADYAWVRPADMAAYPFSKADLRIIEALRSHAAARPAAGRRGRR